MQAKNNLMPLTSDWPFKKQGVDIVGLFQRSREGKILLVVVDYITTWVEAKPLATIAGNQVKWFVWEQIACLFGLPLYIIIDSGKKIADNPLKKLCGDLYIKQILALVAYP